MKIYYVLLKKVKMKKHIFMGFIALFLLNLNHDLFAQKEILASLLDKTIELSESRKVAELTETLTSTTYLLESEAYTRGFDMKDKLLGKVKVLKSFIPLSSAGTLKPDILSKEINTIRLLIGANHINNLLSEGKEGLLGNGVYLRNSVDLLQLGKEILDDKKKKKLTNLLKIVSETVSKLDKKGEGSRAAASSVRKTLEEIIGLVKEAV